MPNVLHNVQPRRSSRRALTAKKYPTFNEVGYALGANDGVHIDKEKPWLTSLSRPRASLAC